ncbi:MAG: hypothetical protein IRZ32_08895 [Solirubrobacteraceae bacterium]|nr:hypothetical protein [Solirubrobacteraceae bacterium]
MSLSRRRRIAVWSLVVAGGLAAVLAVFAIWSARQLLNEREWRETSARLIADPALQEALAAYLVDEVYQHADVAGALEAALPPRLDRIAGPAAGALREPLTEGVRRILDAPGVQRLWVEAAGRAHDRFLALVEDRGTVLRRDGGAVVLDLRPLLTAVAGRLGLEIDVERLPDGVGRIVIMDGDQLDALQRAVRLLRALAVALPLVALALFAAAIALARGRRRETLAACALAVAVAAILVLLLRSIVGDAVVDALAQTATAQGAAGSVWAIGTSLLAQVARTALVLALLVALAAWLAGPAGPARRLRAWARPALSGRPELVHGVALAALLGLLALGLVPGIRTFAAAGLLVVVVVAGVEMVRRQALRE